ncbi:SPOR domain-containing protein [Bombella mellum]|uniref:SPOR domain-containing protein n=1 Tax=Bombella mellum TaxID=2039288 RepID=A0ABR5ZQN7_9PROT|nr:SPOR domain-containing protein [Bombella mellum]MBA5726647.1 hypothetical protein [Bombella mellum]
MSMPDDYRNSRVSPPHQDERLGAEGRRPLGRMAAREGHGYAPRPGFMASLIGSHSGTRGLMLLGVAGAALLLVVGGVWSWVVTHHPAGVPVIGPPPYPVKDRPEDPGGMMVMGDDTTKSDVTGKGAVHLAPPPEQPDAGLLARRMEQQRAADASADAAQKASSAGSSPAATSSAAGGMAAPAGKETSSDTGVAGDDTTTVVKDGIVEALPAPMDHKQEAPETPAASEEGEAVKAPEGAGSRPKSAPTAASDDDGEETESPSKEAVKKPEVKKKKAAPAHREADDGDEEEEPHHRTAPSAAAPRQTALPPPVPLETSHRKSGEAGQGGRYEVQLAALPNEEQARQEWSRLRHRLPDLLGAYEPVYRKVERDGKNFVRLRVGSFADRAAARQLCVRLHAQAQACAVAAN